MAPKGKPKNKPRGTTTAGIINAGTGGINLGGSGLNVGAGVNTGIPSTSSIDTAVIPVLDAAGDDPFNLSSILPNVGPGHAPMSVVQRVKAVVGLPFAKQQQLGSVLAQAGIIKAKKQYTTGEVQSGLTTAFKYTQEAGTGSLSRTLNERVQQGAGASSSTTSKSGTTKSATGTVTIPTPTATQTTYTTQDLQETANAAAQKLVGRDATPAELQAITNQANAIEAQRAQDTLSTSEASTAANDVAANAGSQVDQFLAAVRQHESGGNYQAYNSKGGASGAYQYIQSTWSSEAKAAGYGQYAGGPASAAPPAVQDAVARFNATNLFNQYGSWKNAAEAWYYPAWAGDASKQNSVPYPSAGNTETIGAYGDQIVAMMGEAAPTPPPSPNAGVNSPVGPGLKQGRTDQGVDWTGSGPLFAVGSGTILSTTNSGWPGGAFIALKLDHPIDPQHSVVYYAENIKPGVKVGQKVQAGQQIGQATGANNARGSGIEIGWGDPNAIGSALAHGAGGEGAVTAQGQSFLDYISGGGGNQALAAAAKAGGTPYLTALYQNTQAMQNAVNSPGANAATLTTTPYRASPAELADAYYMNQQSGDYQAHNLLGIFSKINDSLKQGGAQAAGVGAGPIDMRAQA